MSAYAAALTEAMDWLAQDPRVLFLGQSVGFPGTAMSGTLRNVPAHKKLELPVAEEMQMGMSIGLALQGRVPVSIFPRWNFLLLAMNQLVNHLDKLPLIGAGHPKVLIRVGVGSGKPMDPGPQHLGDYSAALASMCQTVRVVAMPHPSVVVPAYRAAMERGGASVMVEYSELYNA